MNSFKKRFNLVTLVIIVAIMITSCSPGETDGKEISFADAGWDSIRFHNAVAGTIVEELWDYSWSEIAGTTPVTHQGLMSGQIDAHMEIWTANIPTYDEDLANGRLKELSINFDDNYQGVYVPRYVIEGDAERGIEASAPDLQYVWDLKEYPLVFPDADNPDMGRMYGGIPGWEADEILNSKFMHYGFDENFIYFRPGSDSALSAAITSAIDRGEPIAAYYWEPTWLLGMHDMVLLEDEPFDPETFMDGATEFPPVSVNIGVSNDFAAAGHEEVIAFLSNYQTSSQLTSEALGYMQDTGADYIETAKWFLNENSELLDEWLSADDAQTIKDILNN